MQINRRSFLKSGSAMLAEGSLAGCVTKPDRSSALKSSTDRLLADTVMAGDVPGVVAAVTTQDSTIYEAAFGVRALGQSAAMSADTVMWIASMTKPLVAAAAMQLVEQGRIGLDDPAAKIIPELGDFKVIDGWDTNGQPILRPAKTQITLRNLLTHTAGFTYDIWNPDTARFYKTMNIPSTISGKNISLRIPLAFDPGERWEYGINLDWTGKLIEAVSGMKLSQYLKQNLTDPLGMNSTAFRITPEMRARLAKVHARGSDGKLVVTAFEMLQDPEFESGGGGLYSTIEDYQRFMRMILNGGRGNSNQVLNAQTVDLMSRNSMGNLRVRMLPTQSPAKSLDAEFFVGTPKSWGLSFMINEETAPTGRSVGSLSWAGLANTYFWIDPKKRIAGAIMMQLLPFVDTKALALSYAYEKNVYGSMS